MCADRFADREFDATPARAQQTSKDFFTKAPSFPREPFPTVRNGASTTPPKRLRVVASEVGGQA